MRSATPHDSKNVESFTFGKCSCLENIGIGKRLVIGILVLEFFRLEKRRVLDLCEVRLFRVRVSSQGSGFRVAHLDELLHFHEADADNCGLCVVRGAHPIHEPAPICFVKNECSLPYSIERVPSTPLRIMFYIPEVERSYIPEGDGLGLMVYNGFTVITTV